MIERGIRPRCRVVAQFARRREPGGRMSWIRRTRVVLLMTRIAKRAIQRVVIVDVAIGTEPRRYCMHAC